MPPFNLTPGQQEALNTFLEFIQSKDRIYILRGYAGTGKTTLVRVFIEHFQKRDIQYHLLASTGRAAKILSNLTGEETSTVHSHIYTFRDFNKDLEEELIKQEATGIDSTGQLYLTFALVPLPADGERGRRFYIIDEASMIADTSDHNITQAYFGSGRLLKDLLDYDPGGKFLFVGDHIQLPPVVRSDKPSFSPALSMEYFKETYGLKGPVMELTEILRQQEGHDIILASQKIRNLYNNVPQVKWGKLPLKGYRNILLYNNNDNLLQKYLETIQGDNYNRATLITYKNKRTNELAGLIRPNLGRQGDIQPGDLLLVTQNNYPSGLMNGDMVVITEVNSKRIKKAKLSFVNVVVKEQFTGRECSSLLIEDLVYSNEVNLNHVQMNELFMDFFIRMRKEGIKQKTEQFKSRLMNDPYLNAIRAVYGYAITCHKAQGGEWDHIFLDIPRNLTLEPTKSTYQWVYTAITRAREQLHLVNDFYIEEGRLIIPPVKITIE